MLVNEAPYVSTDHRGEHNIGFHAVINQLFNILWNTCFCQLSYSDSYGCNGEYQCKNCIGLQYDLQFASRTCRNACQYRWLSVSVGVCGGENVPGACATRHFTYLARGPWGHFAKSYGFLEILQHNVLMAFYQKRLEIDKQIFTFVGRSVSLSYSAYVQNLCVIL